MLGGYLVISWIAVFTMISYSLCSFLKLDNALMRTIFVWSFLMIFIAIFEMMLLFYYDYLEKKGKYYYDKDMCYWTEDASPKDAFSYKMYMDLYADYSLSDKRYCGNFKENEGARFVLTGEVIHGLFCIVMSAIILYLYFVNNKTAIYIAAILFSGIQFALIIWYLSSVFLEHIYNKNEKFWWYPLLWNVPWIIVPLYIIYYAFIEIMKIPSNEKKIDCINII